MYLSYDVTDLAKWAQFLYGIPVTNPRGFWVQRLSCPLSTYIRGGLTSWRSETSSERGTQQVDHVLSLFFFPMLLFVSFMTMHEMHEIARNVTYTTMLTWQYSIFSTFATEHEIRMRIRTFNFSVELDQPKNRQAWLHLFRFSAVCRKGLPSRFDEREAKG